MPEMWNIISPLSLNSKLLLDTHCFHLL